MSLDLNDKKLDIEAAVKEVMTDEKFCTRLLDNLLSKNETLRYNSSRILLSITAQKPEILYLFFFITLPGGKNSAFSQPYPRAHK